MKKKVAVTMRRIIGWLLVVFGAVGLLLPLLQGILFLVVGLYVLSLDSTWFRNKLSAWAARDGRVADAYQKVDQRIRHFFGI